MRRKWLVAGLLSAAILIAPLNASLSAQGASVDCSKTYDSASATYRDFLNRLASDVAALETKPTSHVLCSSSRTRYPANDHKSGSWKLADVKTRMAGITDAAAVAWKAKNLGYKADWCAWTVSFLTRGLPNYRSSDSKQRAFTYVSTLMNNTVAKGGTLINSTSASKLQPGDLVGYYDSGRSRTAEFALLKTTPDKTSLFHMGIVIGVSSDGKKVIDIEGNRGGSGWSNNEIVMGTLWAPYTDSKTKKKYEVLVVRPNWN
jgi:hypothetical protein